MNSSITPPHFDTLVKHLHSSVLASFMDDSRDGIHHASVYVRDSLHTFIQHTLKTMDPTKAVPVLAASDLDVLHTQLHSELVTSFSQKGSVGIQESIQNAYTQIMSKMGVEQPSVKAPTLSA